jgi:hypothetical protein
LAELKGTVEQTNGDPVVGARVQARNLTSAPEATTSASGTYSLNIPPGIYNVVVLPPESPQNAFIPFHEYITLTSGGATKDITLASGPARTLTLSGTVKNFESGAAVQGAAIEVRDRAFLYYVRKTTGAAGDFSFSVAAGDYAIDISLGGFTTRRAEYLVKADMTGLDLRIFPSALGSSVSGNVKEVRQAGNVNSQDAVVVATGAQGFAAQQKVDGSGNYNIPVPSNGSFTVEVFNNSRLAKPRTVASGATGVDWILPVDVDSPRTFAITNPPANASVQRPITVTGQVNDTNGASARGQVLVGQFLRFSGNVGEYALRKTFGERGQWDLRDTAPLPLSRVADGNLSFSFGWDTWYPRGAFTDGNFVTNASGTLDHWTWGDVAVPASFKVNNAATPELAVALFRKESGAGDYVLDAVVANRTGAAWLATKETQQFGLVAPAEVVLLVSSSTGDLAAEQERSGPWLELSRGVTGLEAPACGRHYVIPVGWDYGNNKANTAGGVLVDNCPPTAKFASPPSVEPGEQFTLDAANSTDDTFISSYEWTIAGPQPANSSDRKWTLSISQEGDYTIRLRVTDGAGNSDEEPKTLKVQKIADNQAPVAVAQVPGMVKVGIQFSIDGRQSSDNIKVVKHRWEWFLNGTLVDSVDTAFHKLQLNTTGRYCFTLTVWDAAQNSDEDTKCVAVVNVVDTIPPIADAGGNRLATQAGAASCDTGTKWVESGDVVFDGSKSKDEGGSGILRWTWKLWREGTEPEWANATVFTKKFTEAGTYHLLLEVEDGAFNTDTDSITVEVLPYDEDNDRLPDSWERTYFGDLRARPTDDRDEDGVDNRGEMCGLSDPRLPESYTPQPKEGVFGFLDMLMPIILLAVGGAVIFLIVRKLKQRGEGVELPPAQ